MRPARFRVDRSEWGLSSEARGRRGRTLSVANLWSPLRGSSPSERAIKMETAMVHVVMRLALQRFLRVADEGPGEGGADGTEGDDDPGRVGNRGGEGVAVGEQGVEDGAGGGEGDGAGEDAGHRQ